MPPAVASLFATTDRGLVRAADEDAAYAATTSGGAVLTVADGMGGHPGGDRASALAIAAAERARGCDAAPEACLERLWREALATVRDAAAADALVAAMGTTLTAAIVHERQVWLLHIGDSRAYLRHRGGLRALTVDHSLAGEAVRAGELDAAAALDDPRRHVLTRAISIREAQPDYLGPFDVVAGDLVLLVTDGVTGVLTEAQVAAAIGEHGPREAAGALLTAVHAQGAPDNIGIAALQLGA